MHTLRNTLIILLAAAPIAAFAQLTPDPLQFTVTPQLPGPHQGVTISAQGVGGFLGDANIVWQQDGKTTLSGPGENSYTFTTGALGSVTNIHVSVASPSQGNFTRDFVVRPSLVYLVWEAGTTVPPLFGGKALYSAGSPLKVVAFPQVYVGGSRVSTQSLSFKWQRDGDPAIEQSGLGRNSFTFIGDSLNSSEEVSVDVYLGSFLVAQSAITIPAVSPSVMLYQQDPLRGVLYDQALPQGGISLSAKEMTIAAQPYYFSNISAKNGSLNWAWTLGGEDATGPDSSRGLLTLRQTGTGVGQVELDVTVQNNDQDLLTQSANAVLNIVFGQQASSGFASFFGL